MSASTEWLIVVTISKDRVMLGEAFAHALLDAHQIAVMPGESFGQAAAGHIRVAMTVADDQFSEALAVLLSFAAEICENKRRF